MTSSQAAKRAEEKAEDRAREEYKQLKFCRYAKTVLAKRAMAKIIHEHGAAWSAAADADEALQRAESELKAQRERQAQLRRQLAVAHEAAAGPEQLINKYTEQLEEAHSALLRSRAEAARAQEELFDANKRMGAACASGDPRLVLTTLRQGAGWSAVPSIAGQAVRMLLEVGTRDLAGLSSLQQIPTLQPTVREVLRQQQQPAQSAAAAGPAELHDSPAVCAKILLEVLACANAMAIEVTKAWGARVEEAFSPKSQGCTAAVAESTPARIPVHRHRASRSRCCAFPS